MQCLNLKLSGALWSARASASGFSVSLYWPTADTVHGSVHVKAKKARKNRKHRKRKQVSACITNNQSVPSAPVVQSNSSQPSMCPNKEHLGPDYGFSDSENSCHSGSEQCSTDAGSPPTTSNNSSAVDLTTCSNVQYKMKDDVHGLSFRNHLGEQAWTPVIGKKKKRTIPDYVKRRFPPDHPIHKQNDQSDAESESDERRS